MIENWEQYEDLEYYPDRFCKCDCGGRVRVYPHHKYRNSIPEYIRGHNARVNDGMSGKHHTREAKQKNREAHLGQVNPIRDKTFEEYYGEEKAKELKQKNRESHEGMVWPGLPEFVKRLWQDPEYREKQRKARKIAQNRPEVKERSRETAIELWQDPEYIAMQMIARNVCPNKAELFLDELFQDLLPNEYKFVGDGEFILAGKCPDFVNVNGQKKIIELFGEHVHKPEEEQERMDLFAQYGFQTLVIWFGELRNLDLVKQKLMEFNNV